MGKRSVRVDSALEAKETEIFAYYGVQGDTYSDRYRDFIVKVHKAMRLNEVSQIPSNPAMHPAENVTVLRCPLRKTITVNHRDKKTGVIQWQEKKLACVDNPPKRTFLDGIEICEVCIEKFYGLARKLKNVSAEPTGEPVLAGQKPEPDETAEPPTPIQTVPDGFVFHSLSDFRKVAFTTKADGRRFCPFSPCLKTVLDCHKCRTNSPEKNQQCRTLRASC